MSPKNLGLASASLYLLAGGFCVTFHAQSSSNIITLGIGIYFVGRSLQMLSEVLRGGGAQTH